MSITVKTSQLLKRAIENSTMSKSQLDTINYEKLIGEWYKASGHDLGHMVSVDVNAQGLETLFNVAITLRRKIVEPHLGNIAFDSEEGKDSADRIGKVEALAQGYGSAESIRLLETKMGAEAAKKTRILVTDVNSLRRSMNRLPTSSIDLDIRMGCATLAVASRPTHEFYGRDMMRGNTNGKLRQIGSAFGKVYRDTVNSDHKFSDRIKHFATSLSELISNIRCVANDRDGVDLDSMEPGDSGLCQKIEVLVHKSRLTYTDGSQRLTALKAVQAMEIACEEDDGGEEGGVRSNLSVDKSEDGRSVDPNDRENEVNEMSDKAFDMSDREWSDQLDDDTTMDVMTREESVKRAGWD